MPSIFCPGAGVKRSSRHPLQKNVIRLLRRVFQCAREYLWISGINSGKYERRQSDVYFLMGVRRSSMSLLPTCLSIGVLQQQRAAPPLCFFGNDLNRGHSSLCNGVCLRIPSPSILMRRICLFTRSFMCTHHPGAPHVRNKKLVTTASSTR